MGLISPGGENLLDFLELRQVLSTYVGDLRDTLWWPQERPVPKRVTRWPLGGLSGFLSRRCWGLRPCVEWVLEPEDSCPVLTWILGYFWSLPRVVRPRLDGGMHVRFPHELKQQCQVSLRVDQGICGFPSRLSHEAFPRRFPTGLSHVSPWCESILGLKVEAVQGKQVSLEWTETSRGLWECGKTLDFLSPFLWRAPPLEMRQERREFFPEHARKGSLLLS